MTSRAGLRLRLVHTVGRGGGTAPAQMLAHPFREARPYGNPHAPAFATGKDMSTTKNTTTEPAGAARRSATADDGLDLEAALSRIAGLGDKELEALVHDLDSALAECRGCLAGDTDMNLVSVAASARIALRRRRAAAARSRAIHRVHQLISTESTE